MTRGFFGREEKNAVMRVLDSGNLSGYLAGTLQAGPEVVALEQEWAQYFLGSHPGGAHAVAMNSATSCLIAACGAIGLKAGDEVIVPPLTMSASATAPMVYGATPIFADIEPNYFCLDPDSVEAKITERTKAIVVVDLFGQPYDSIAINFLAAKHNLFVIEDASQAPGAREYHRSGTYGHIGVFSLNHHKHIQTGEGGIAWTQHSELAQKMRLLANHAEAARQPYFGFNFRMTEIQAAIGRVQLTRLAKIVCDRQKKATFYRQIGLPLAPVRPGCEHAWYLYPFLFSEAPLSKDFFKYNPPLYQLPVFGEQKPLPVTEDIWEKLWMLKP